MTLTIPIRPFIEWGGPAWRVQLERGLAWLGPVEGLRVLEVGARSGRVATWFALNGADVLGLDVSPEPLADARRFASLHGVATKVKFDVYSGNPALLPRGFDVVFSKSTTILMDVDAAVDGFARALNESGRVLMVENARGPLLLHVIRMIRRASLRPYGADYFTRATVPRIARRFDVGLEHWLGPVAVIGGRKLQGDDS